MGRHTSPKGQKDPLSLDHFIISDGRAAGVFQGSMDFSIWVHIELDMLAHGIGSEDNPILPGIYEWSLMSAGGSPMVFPLGSNSSYILDRPLKSPSS